MSIAIPGIRGSSSIVHVRAAFKTWPKYNFYRNADTAKGFEQQTHCCYATFLSPVSMKADLFGSMRPVSPCLLRDTISMPIKSACHKEKP